MLQHLPAASASSTRWWRLVVVAAVAGLVPIQVVARRAPDGPHLSLDRDVPASSLDACEEGGPSASAAIALPSSGARGVDRAAPDAVPGRDVADAASPARQTPPPPDALDRPPSGRHGVGAPPALPPLPPDSVEQPQVPPPLPPAPPAAPAPPVPPAKAWGYAFGESSDGTSWVYVSGDRTSMRGSSSDARRVRERFANGEPVFWFTRDGQELIVRDPATLKAIDALLAPQRELGRRQGELGAKQGEIGARQGAIGAKQGELGARQGRLGVEQARLAAERARAEGGAHDAVERDRIRTREAELRADMEALQREMEALGQQMADLGRQQEPLGRQQAELGRQQAELGRQQKELSRRIEEDLGVLMDQLVKSGVAQPVK
jgi:bla regulator protein BlaR1